MNKSISLTALILLFFSILSVVFYADNFLLGLSSNDDWYRKMASEILWVCNGYYCESPFVPFISYVLTMYKTNRDYITLNYIIILILFVALTYAIISFYKNYLNSFILVSYVYFSIHIKQFILNPIFPDFCLILLYCLGLVILESKSNLNKISLLIITTAITCHMTIGVIVSFLIISFYLLHGDKKIDRKKVIIIINSMALACTIVMFFLYLNTDSIKVNNRFDFLIHNYISVIKNSGLTKVPYFETLPLLPLLFLIFILLYKRNKLLINYLFFVLIVALFFQFIALDPVRIFITILIPSTFIILLYEFPKKYTYNNQILFIKS